MKDEREEVGPSTLVEMEFLERIMRRLPHDLEVLVALGDLYTRVGRYEDGLAIDRLLVTMQPEDMTIWYNLGCSLALLGKRDEALKALKRAIELGYSDHEWMSRDADLQSLREDRAFKSLIRTLASPASGKAS